MIIKCEKCGTRFRMADEKMQPDGIKVRCAKCQAVFRAMPTEAPPASMPPAETPRQAPAPQTELPGGFDFAAGPASPETQQPEDDFDFGTAERSTAEEPQGDDFDLGDFDIDRDTSASPDFEKVVPATEPDAINFNKAIPEEEGTDEFGDFSFTEAMDEDFAEGARPPEQDQDALGDFSFAEDQSAIPPAEDKEEFDFSPEEPGAQAPVEEEEDFDFSAEDLGATFTEDEEEEEEIALVAGEAPEADRDFSDEDFSLSSADESDELPPRPSAKLAPAAAAADAALSAKATDMAPAAGAAERLPPRAEEAAAPLIARPAPRKSPVASLMVFLLVLLIVLTAITGYLFWQKGPQAFEQLILGLTGEKAVPPGSQEGIDLRALQSLFVANQEAGELFVIHGQAVNRFAEPRSAIQVKGVVYAADGKPILQQTVFCGNALSDEDLRTLPYAGIEEAMNNQFGETLSNLNVRPGQTIPFTIVFRNLPPNMSEFTVEIVDSRPVTADQ
ncbi:DUF3426 domain-containing protein [Geoalkalibacter sp.]|uniref:DUF3426 domain-containing protein n=1 Tax=Geoalkalibacter sp. TaxID=3041440 RepID=UPI00272ED857|nr:DUF3426 domain-containing protein [Geoalkalibacter sp.]